MSYTTLEPTSQKQSLEENSSLLPAVKSEFVASDYQVGNVEHDALQRLKERIASSPHLKYFVGK